MAAPTRFTDVDMLAAMARGLDDHIRKCLRERIEAIIKPDIDDAINAAMQTFKVQIEAHYNHLHMENLLKILIEDKREKTP